MDRLKYVHYNGQRRILMPQHKNGSNGKNEPKAGTQPKISRLGQQLREISDQALASGTKTLSLEEIHGVISKARGGTA
jgi:hypothetical protein